MTLFKRVVFLAAMTALAGAVFAQTSVSLEAEIQNLEKAANRQGISPSERHDALAALARLRQLSGDIEGAARNWLEAAAAIPGQVDDDALLACAYCLAAMGEWDRARTALEPLLSKSARARFLDASINAISTGNEYALAAIADNPEFVQMKNEVYFLLWKISSGPAAERWRQRLLAEFPQSPEGRLAAAAVSAAVTIKTSPFWLFLNGLDSLPVLESETAARPATQAAASVPQSAPSSQPSTSQVAVRLQTGLFSREANARSQIASLTQAGFSPSIERRSEMWAVTVPEGADQARTIRELKAAGFDSFPVR
jgi:tetratricopeptide (TPR) repeat protein